MSYATNLRCRKCGREIARHVLDLANGQANTRAYGIAHSPGGIA